MIVKITCFQVLAHVIIIVIVMDNLKTEVVIVIYNLNVELIVIVIK